ncbi:MAG: 1-deoxy-D-xylulose-5-phosphate reductoisomerase [Actinomycetaceae bacterium]|nr:1-deoxy-D-xylulose-5-phosphate reductoisomerase [Actinomycetaceae bacterium]
MRTVTILGSTGSIGTQALDVIERNPQALAVRALGAGGAKVELLARQAAKFAPEVVAVADARAVDALGQALRRECDGRPPEILAGLRAMAEIAALAGTDVVLNGITGSIGLEPTLAALGSGASLALANKESLVAGGSLVAAALRRPGQIVPVDSEHSAIAQALASGRHRRGMTSPVVDGTSQVRRIILTASGGPFRGRSREELADVTPRDALAHPTWDMGPVVTVNSSTLMNKALELIEAAYLFDVEPDAIVPVVHPQSVVHSMVEFDDGSTIAQASPPDMRLPIALGLSWPERMSDVARPCAWDAPVAWTFEPLDSQTFPAVDLARSAVAASPLHPAVLNAANEECVRAFLDGGLGYLGIVETVEAVLGEFSAPGEEGLDAVAEAERWARARANELMGV